MSQQTNKRTWMSHTNSSKRVAQSYHVCEMNFRGLFLFPSLPVALLLLFYKVWKQQHQHLPLYSVLQAIDHIERAKHKKLVVNMNELNVWKERKGRRRVKCVLLFPFCFPFFSCFFSCDVSDDIAKQSRNKMMMMKKMFRAKSFTAKLFKSNYRKRQRNERMC